MNRGLHLGVNIIALIVLTFLIKPIYNILSLNLFHLVIAVYIFSNLPDIDNSKSYMSQTFFLFYTTWAVLSIIQKNYLQLISAILLFIYHFLVREDSKHHRKFPHTFTFGAITSLMLWHFTSLPIAIIGYACFISHLILDNHILAALRKDAKFWQGRYWIF